MLKEADLLTGFTEEFTSVASREVIAADVLRRRLLLVLFALGTNMGIKRDRPRANTARPRPRCATCAACSSAATTCAGRSPGSSTPPSPSATRPVGRGHRLRLGLEEVRVVGLEPDDRVAHPLRRARGDDLLARRARSACIYSQLKTCSASEVAAMIEGVMRHCTDAEIDRNYVDTHGQSAVGFAFTHLLGFQLLPRLKNIGSSRLYRPDAGTSAYPPLAPVLTRPIRWDLIAQQYDQMVKYATALRLGTAEAEAILRRFTRPGPQAPHLRRRSSNSAGPSRPIFLADYLRSTPLRREIHEGLQVVENWNSANALIFYGKDGELTGADRESQEISMLCLHLLQSALVHLNTLLLQTHPR